MIQITYNYNKLLLPDKRQICLTNHLRFCTATILIRPEQHFFNIQIAINNGLEIKS